MSIINVLFSQVTVRLYLLWEFYVVWSPAGCDCTVYPVGHSVTDCHCIFGAVQVGQAHGTLILTSCPSPVICRL